MVLCLQSIYFFISVRVLTLCFSTLRSPGCPVTGTAQEDECPNGLKSKGLVRRNHTKAPASKSIAIAMTSAAKGARPGCFILSPSAEVVSRAHIIDYSSVDQIC